MGRLIIQNDSSISDYEAVLKVSQVISKGRVSKSETQYCYATLFEDGVIVFAELNKKSDRFVVRDYMSDNDL